jgi:hypothetical protein
VSVLPVTLDGVKLLCGIGDTSQDTGVSALIALEQPALEYALDPAILANSAHDAGLLATLTLGVSEVLAGSYVATQGRNPADPMQQTALRLATLSVAVRPLTLPTVIGPALAATGLARLAPFSRSARALARTASGTDALLDDQAPVPLVLGSGIGAIGAQPGTGGAYGPPPDPDFDRVLGTDGRTEPTGLDDVGLEQSPWLASWP